MEKIDIEQGKKLRGRQKMTWMEVVKKDMKLLKLEERMVADRGEGSMYWIEYKLFVFLGSSSRPHIIGIKAGWFGFEKASFLQHICNQSRYTITTFPKWKCLGG